LHWLSSWSKVRGQLQKYIENDVSLLAELQAIAESDFTTFLTHRNEELKPGGRMILQALTWHLKQKARYYTLLRMQQEGLISSEPLQNATINMCSLSKEFITSAISKYPSLHLLDLQEYEYIDEFSVQYEADGDRAGVARRRTAMIRTINESLVKDLLKEEHSGEVDLVEVYFAYMEEYYRENPVPVQMKEVDVIVEKTHN
jgi:hypothetical protein